MASPTVETLEASLSRLDVGVTHTEPARFAEALASVSTEPAVGTPLPGGPSLPDWVETAPTAADLEAAVTGITGADLAVADYGSLLLPSTPEGGEPVSLFVDHHVAVLRADDVVPDMAAAFAYLGPELRDGDVSSAVLATGPSATADMGALVKGAHGPKTVHVVLVDDAGDGSADGDPGAGDE